MKIIIKGQLPDLNTEINELKKHWAIYAKHKKYWTQYIAMEIKRQKIGQIKPPIAPKFTWFTKNERMDCDNISFAKKYILDGLVLAEIIPNDSRKYVIGFQDCFEVDKNNPRVEIEV